MQNIIFKTKVGSHAYGTNIEGSDEDFKGVYIQSLEDIAINGYVEQINTTKDETYYELRRFIELCQSANPTVLELLYSPKDCIITKHPVFDLILEHKDIFLTKKCKYSFGGYAYAQIEKAKGLEKKMNWEASEMTRKTPLDFCYIITPLGAKPLKDWLHTQKGKANWQENYGVSVVDKCKDLYFIYPDKTGGELGYHGIVSTKTKLAWQELDEEEEVISNDLCLSSIPKDQMHLGTVMSYSKDSYTRHCKMYREYTEWLKKRNVQRYVDIENHGQRIDGKNLLHCYRLIETAIEIAQQKTINVRRPNAEFLIEIRKGKHNLDTLLNGASEKIEVMNKIFDKCDLPHSCDMKFCKELITKIRLKYEKSVSV